MRAKPTFSDTEFKKLDPVAIPHALSLEFFEDTVDLLVRRKRQSAAFGSEDGSLLRHMGKLITPSGMRSAHAEAIALTMYSAVPVADAVRGIFDFCGIETPPMLGIDCNKSAVQEFDFHPYARHREIDRLAAALEGRQKVVLIEQYVNKGAGIHAAGDLLQEAGATRVSAIGGKWYQDAGFVDVDTRALTSDMSEPLYSAGLECAKIYLEMCSSSPGLSEAETLVL